MAKRSKPKRGQGSVRLHDGKYQASVQLSGKRYWQSFDKEADAWNWLSTLKSDHVRGVLKVEEKKKDIRFDDLCRLYRIHKAPRWRPGMASYFDGHLKTTLLPAFRERFISTMTAQEIQSWLDSKLTSVAGSTVNKYLQVLKAVFGHALRLGYIDRSPMAAVERAKAEPKRTRPLRLFELQSFLRACTPEDKPFFTILFFCGLRRGEIFRMAWDWVDMERGILHVKVAKRGSSEIPMAEPVREAFLELGPRKEGIVFPGSGRTKEEKARQDDSKPLTDKKRTLKSTLKRAGLDPNAFTFHSFRHSFISLIEETGAPYSVVKTLARHGATSGDITFRYLHPTDEQLRHALAMLTEKVLGPARVVPMLRTA